MNEMLWFVHRNGQAFVLRGIAAIAVAIMAYARPALTLAVLIGLPAVHLRKLGGQAGNHA